MSDINQLSVMPRPRSAWQAMDAGFGLGRAHYLKLIYMWLGFSLPVFIVCMAIQLWLGWGFMILVWWWFKPLYELPLLFFLSKAVFSQDISTIQSWKLTLKHFWRLFRSYLTLARFSTARSLSYSVVFLEMLPGKKRNKRIQTLTAIKTRHYILMIVCIHIEYIIAYGLITILGLTFFSSTLSELSLDTLLNILDSPAYSAVSIAIAASTFAASALVSPFYVSGGFLLYINRRMQLEAWDIEHRFRNIKPRTRKSSLLAVFCIFGLFLGGTEQSIAADRSETIMSPSEAIDSINEIMTHPDFGTTKIRRVPTFAFDEDDSGNDQNEANSRILKWLANAASSIADFFNIVLWIVAAIFIGLLLYTLFRFKQSYRKPSALSRHRHDGEDAVHHPLTQDLPNDIAGTAERLLASGQQRQALSVLFRGALRSVMTEHDLRIPSGATESDCKKSVASVANETQNTAFKNLLSVWQKAAYANEPQSTHIISSLISDWKNAFVATSTAHNKVSDP